MNLFCKVAIRGVWSDKAMMTSLCVLGGTRHKDLNDFLQPTHNDCTAAPLSTTVVIHKSYSRTD